MAEIGFVGLGNMGGPMAANLIKAGHKLRVFDLSQAAMDKLVGAGAAAASSRKRCRQGRRSRRHHASSRPACPRHLSRAGRADRRRAARLPIHRLLDHRRRNRA